VLTKNGKCFAEKKEAYFFAYKKLSRKAKFQKEQTHTKSAVTVAQGNWNVIKIFQ